jgi:hypothetical protein
MDHGRRVIPVKVALSLLVTLCLSTIVLATPANDVKLTYDAEKKILHISAKHPSTRLDHNYIRRIVILKDGAFDKEVALTRQKIAAGMEEDIEYEVSEGNISVELYSSEGGKATGELTVVAPPKEEKIVYPDWE